VLFEPFSEYGKLLVHFQLVFVQFVRLFSGLESSDAHVSVLDQVLQPDDVFNSRQKLAVIQCQLRFPNPFRLRRLALNHAVVAHVWGRVHAKHIPVESGKCLVLLLPLFNLFDF